MLGQQLVTESIQPFSNQRDVSQKAEIYLHQMTLPGLSVTQYMYVLFDQVHIYIEKPQFTLAPCSEMPPKHPEKLQRATSNNRNTHHKL